MKKSQKTWLVIAAIFQWLTAVLHSSTLLVSPKPENDTEKQLLDLMNSYKKDMGAGFHPSVFDLYTFFNISFSLLLFFGALLTSMLIRNKLTGLIAKNIMAIQTIIFTCCFLALLAFTFIVPVICVALILVACIGSWWVLKK